MLYGNEGRAPRGTCFSIQTGPDNIQCTYTCMYITYIVLPGVLVLMFGLSWMIGLCARVKQSVHAKTLLRFLYAYICTATLRDISRIQHLTPFCELFCSYHGPQATLSSPASLIFRLTCALPRPCALHHVVGAASTCHSATGCGKSCHGCFTRLLCDHDRHGWATHIHGHHSRVDCSSHLHTALCHPEGP